MVGSAFHDHEPGRRVEDISTAAAEVADVAQPEMVARPNEMGIISTHTVVTPTRVESVKHLLTATKKRPHFKHDIGI